MYGLVFKIFVFVLIDLLHVNLYEKYLFGRQKKERKFLGYHFPSDGYCCIAVHMHNDNGY
jgi:hypothetical protein